MLHHAAKPWRNLVEGEGPALEPAMTKRVQGFTHPLWMFLFGVCLFADP